MQIIKVAISLKEMNFDIRLKWLGSGDDDYFYKTQLSIDIVRRSIKRIIFLEVYFVV